MKFNPVTGFFESHAPGAVLDYGIDYSAWTLESPGDTIIDSAWEIQTTDVAPGSLTILADDLDGSLSSVRVGGGNLGQAYRLVNTITTAEGRIDKRSILLTCRIP